MKRLLDLSRMVSAGAGHAMVRILGGLTLFVTGEPARRSLLAFWLRHSSGVAHETNDADAMTSQLMYWFRAQEFVDREINRLCTQYYKGRHPKHYMWTGHNQYIYDNIRPGDRVLDIGCGASQYQQHVADKACEVICIDINPARVEQSRQNNMVHNVHFELMDATAGFPPGRFDVAICSHVLEHLDDPASLLRRIAETIPRLVVKVPLQDSHWMKLVKRDIGMPWMDDRDHRREYTEIILREQLIESGWKITEMVRGADLRATALSIRISSQVSPADADQCAE